MLRGMLCHLELDASDRTPAEQLRAAHVATIAPLHSGDEIIIAFRGLPRSEQVAVALYVWREAQRRSIGFRSTVESEQAWQVLDCLRVANRLQAAVSDSRPSA